MGETNRDIAGSIKDYGCLLIVLVVGGALVVGLTIDRTMSIRDVLYTEPLIRTRGFQRGDPADGLIESPPCDPNAH